MNEPLKRTPPEVIRALAGGAKDKLADVAFAEAILDLKAQWYAELLAEDDDLKGRDIKARLKALEAIYARLNSMAVKTK